MPPAARLTDPHVCPMVTPGLPPIPHVGGPITGPGARKTFIAGLPAARVGDKLMCVGPPDTIVLGSFTCLIEGKPAARMGDQCAHGGRIVMGFPTVQIGNSGGAGSPQGRAMSAARAAAAVLATKGCGKLGVTGNASGGAHDAGTAAGASPEWIAVRVTDKAGQPLAGHLVRAITSDGKTLESYSGADGRVRFDGIAPGHAKISLSEMDGAFWKLG